MATEVIMPKVDMVMETGTLVEWLIEEGGHVNKGDALFVITTDKAAIEVESPADGILAGVNAKVDDIIPVTEVIAYILNPGESLPVAIVHQPTIDSALTTPKIETAIEATVAVTENAECDKVRATPVARRMAEELGLDLSQISGRGPRGRIHKADVLAFQKPLLTVERSSLPVAAPTPIMPVAPVIPTLVSLSGPISLPDAKRKQVIPITGPRKIIAERMAYSISTAPHINLSLRVDMT